jgi:hypothetical protein
LTAAGAFRSLTTEGTEATEAGGKGFRIRARPSFRSVSVIFVLSVVRFDPRFRPMPATMTRPGI